MTAQMSPLRWCWLVLAVLGAVVPLAYLVGHWGSGGGSLWRAWMESPASAALAYGLVIANSTLVIWIGAEVWVRRNWEVLWAVPATILFGVSCGLPLYLCLRTTPVT